MTYLVQSTRPHSLIIGYTDCTSRFKSMTVSDDSYFRNGIVTTTGTLVLSTVWDQAPAAFYANGEFNRGTSVTLSMTYPNGDIARHPRGRLYVLSSSYDPENEETILEVGCRLAYDKLLNKPQTYFQYTNGRLAAAKQTFEGVNGNLATYGEFIYQGSDGLISKRKVLSANASVLPEASFVAVRGATCLKVSPLRGAQPVPDKINIIAPTPPSLLPDPIEDDFEETPEPESEVTNPGVEFPPVGQLPEDPNFDPNFQPPTETPQNPSSSETEGVDGTTQGTETALIDPVDKYSIIDYTESEYFVAYPTSLYKRKPDNEGTEEDLENIVADEIEESELIQGTNVVPETTSCGPVPPAPPSLGDPLPPEEGEEDPEDEAAGGAGFPYNCLDNYEIERQTEYVPAYRKTVSQSVYGGPAGQISTNVQATYGPLLEVNSQFYSDKYDFCRRVYSNPCVPGGGCQLFGIEDTPFYLVEKVLTTYFYNADGSVQKTVKDRWVTELAGAVMKDWRAGTMTNDDGEPVTFNNNFDTQHANLFLVQRVTTENYPSRNIGTQDRPMVINSQIIIQEDSPVVRASGIYRVAPNGSATKRPISAIGSGRIVTKTFNRSASTQALDPAPERISQPIEETIDLEYEVITDNDDIEDLFDDSDDDIEVGERPTDPYDGELWYDSATGIIYVYNASTGEWEVDQDPVAIGEDYESDISMPGPAADAETAREAEIVAVEFGGLMKKLLEGEARGLTISESLRKEIADNWVPGCGFRYVDDKNNKVIAMLQDSASWAVDPNGSAVTFTGLFFSETDGVATIPENLSGNATPNMDGGLPTPPPNGGGDTDPGVQPPYVDDDKPIGQTYRLDINVRIKLSNVMNLYGNNGIVPVPDKENIYKVVPILAMAVQGLVGQPGSFVSGSPSGGLPFDFDGSLVVDADTIVNADLFAPAP